MGKPIITYTMTPDDSLFIHPTYLQHNASFDPRTLKPVSTTLRARSFGLPELQNLVKIATETNSTPKQPEKSPDYWQPSEDNKCEARCVITPGLKRHAPNHAFSRQYAMEVKNEHYTTTTFGSGAARTITVMLVRYTGDKQYYVDIQKHKHEAKERDNIQNMGRQINNNWRFTHFGRNSEKTIAETKMITFPYTKSKHTGAKKTTPIYMLYKSHQSLKHITPEFIEMASEINADNTGLRHVLRLCQKDEQSPDVLMNEIESLRTQYREAFSSVFPKCAALVSLYRNSVVNDDTSAQEQHETNVTQSEAGGRLTTTASTLDATNKVVGIDSRAEEHVSPAQNRDIFSAYSGKNRSARNSEGTITPRNNIAAVTASNHGSLPPFLHKSHAPDSYVLSHAIPSDYDTKTQRLYLEPAMLSALTFEGSLYADKLITMHNGTIISTRCAATIDKSGKHNQYNTRITQTRYRHNAYKINYMSKKHIPVVMVLITEDYKTGQCHYDIHRTKMKQGAVDTLNDILGIGRTTMALRPQQPRQTKMALYVGDDAITTHQPTCVSWEMRLRSPRLTAQFVEASDDIPATDNFKALGQLCDTPEKMKGLLDEIRQMRKKCPEQFDKIYPKCSHILRLSESKSRPADHLAETCPMPGNHMNDAPHSSSDTEISDSISNVLNRHQGLVQALGHLEDDTSITPNEGGMRKMISHIARNQVEHLDWIPKSVNFLWDLRELFQNFSNAIEETCPGYIKRHFPKCREFFCDAYDSWYKNTRDQWSKTHQTKTIPTHADNVVPTRSGDLTAATPDEGRNRAVSADTDSGIDNELISTASTLLDNATLASSSHCQSRHGSSKEELGGNDDRAKDSDAARSSSSLSLSDDQGSGATNSAVLFKQDDHDNALRRPDSELSLSTPLCATTDNTHSIGTT